ncbi:hypothetical protein [Calothrix sp. UHCC 0171]|uniref:hypothetical protein n=1 Tax=Calothrix sp. UHCC 0171 TaxID=3110245 RepID=UPI002B1F7C83|nr:hypothetical protein [Calothrix sp. UHCC 0171]MEA5571455.1 hypothetical protein [Calothrix sp. UHCC 0171]
MFRYLAKWLFLWVVIVGTVFLSPDIVNALPNQSQANITPAANNTRVMELTPRQRQMMQAVNQGRNRAISKVLEESQQKKLIKLLRGGDSLNQAVDKLKLSSEQSEMIQAIIQLYYLKMKAVTVNF